jgi:hypothetical protein
LISPLGPRSKRIVAVEVRKKRDEFVGSETDHRVGLARDLNSSICTTKSTSVGSIEVRLNSKEDIVNNSNIKRGLIALRLAMCMPSGYVHAQTQGDAKEPTSRSKVIPAGTILPVRLDSTMQSNKSQPAEIIRATVMQDVHLRNGETVRKGSLVTGCVLQASNPANESDQVMLSFQFDAIRFDNRTIPIRTSLRALASPEEVEKAKVPDSGGGDAISAGSHDLLQIGGDQSSYGTNGPVVVGQETVGRYTSQGVGALRQ